VALLPGNAGVAVFPEAGRSARSEGASIALERAGSLAQFKAPPCRSQALYLLVLRLEFFIELREFRFFRRTGAAQPVEHFADGDAGTLIDTPAEINDD